MSETVRIDYHVGQHGWARFQLTVGTTSVVVGPLSYVTDALGDLVRAALMIATSGDRGQKFRSTLSQWNGVSSLEAIGTLLNQSGQIFACAC